MIIQPHRFKMQQLCITLDISQDIAGPDLEVAEVKVEDTLRQTPTGSRCSLGAPTASPGSPTPCHIRTEVPGLTEEWGHAISLGMRGRPWTTPQTPRPCSHRPGRSGAGGFGPQAPAPGATHCREHSTARLCSGIPSWAWRLTGSQTPCPR